MDIYWSSDLKSVDFRVLHWVLGPQGGKVVLSSAFVLSLLLFVLSAGVCMLFKDL